MNRQTITVDIAPGNSQVQRLSSAQGDIGRPLGVYIIQDGVALDCSGYTADLYILKSDGNYYEGTATVDSQTNNLITWETAEQETPCAGVCAAQIRISANGEDIGTARFVEYVEASPGFVGEGSESTIDTIKGFVRQAEAWATGEKDGIPVSSTDPTYENNAKYYAEQSKQDYDDLAAEINDISDDVADLKTGVEHLEDAVSAQAIICDTPSLPIVTISDGADGQPMRSVEVAIEPVQDLHGQEAPYPAGGGKNLFQTTATSDSINGTTFTVNDDGSVSVSGTPSSSVSSFTFGTVTLPAGSYNVNGFASGSDTTIRMGVYNKTASTLITNVYNGSDKSFTLESEAEVKVYPIVLPTFDGVKVTFYPMIRLATESDATFAPYSNICPISGHESVTVTRTGVNLWDGEWENGTIVSTTGANATSSADWRTKNYIRIFPNKEYFTASMEASGKNVKPRFYDANKNYIGYIVKSGSEDTGSAWVPPDNACFMRFTVTTADVPNHDISINYPSTDTEYHAYQGQSIQIPLGQTVYGGTLDAVAGTLTVDRAMVDLGSLTWRTWDKGRVYSTGVSSTIMPCAAGVLPNLIASKYATTTAAQIANDESLIGIGVNNTNIVVRTGDGNNPSGDIVYELSQPVEVTLTGQQITTILGTNNVWADAGDVSIEYQADTKLYIDKAGQTEDDMTANATISNGQYFQIGTTVYRATATILTGEQIIPGTNAVQTTTTEALNILLAGQSKQWELIREDTFTNASSADHTITADGNSQPFELTDAIMLFETPKQATASEVGSYGQIRFYPSTSGTTYYAAECGAWTQAANSSAHGIMGMLEQRDGLIFLTGTQQVTTSNSANLRMRYGAGFTGASQGIWMASDFTIQRIVIPAVTGTGHYKLFGKRK